MLAIAVPVGTVVGLCAWYYGGIGQIVLMRITDGLFDRFPMDTIFGLHNKPGYDAGSYHITPGATLAAADTFTVRFLGSGAHLSIDTTMGAAQFITTLQAIVRRNVAASGTAVFRPL